jgi:hypothetical protein
MAIGAFLAACLLLISIFVQSPSSVHAARALLQTDAVSNSNGCLEWIPKCEEGACSTRNIMGTARWVCLRCLANYEPVVDSSGQANIIQCGEHAFIDTALSCRKTAVETVTVGTAGQQEGWDC